MTGPSGHEAGCDMGGLGARLHASLVDLLHREPSDARVAQLLQIPLEDAMAMRRRLGPGAGAAVILELRWYLDVVDEVVASVTDEEVDQALRGVLDAGGYDGDAR